MERGGGTILARSVALVALVTAAVGVGFLLGMSRPRERSLDHWNDRTVR